MVDIIVPKKEIHTFDVWGTFVNSFVLGAQKVAAMREIAAKQGISQEEIDRRATLYNDLIHGEDYAQARKMEAIELVENLVKGTTPDYSNAWLPDGINAMEALLSKGHAVALFGSARDEDLWAHLPNGLNGYLTDFYAGKKADVATWVRVGQQISGQNLEWISHSADELPELEAAVKSRLVPVTVMVERLGKDRLQKSIDLGISQYVFSLDFADYRRPTGVGGGDYTSPEIGGR